MHRDRGCILDQQVEDFVGGMMPNLDERQRRLFLGGLSLMLGQGAAKELSGITNISAATISAGRREFKESPRDPTGRPSPDGLTRVRAAGGGRKRIVDKDPSIRDDIISMLDGNTVGDPESPLTWTTLSTTDISEALKAKGKSVSRTTVGAILKEEGFSLQQNKKYMEAGNPGPDRDAQFRFINDQTKAHIADGQPVISVDAKKKELVGNYKNNGREYRMKDDPRLVKDHDFMGPEGKAVPYGVFDVDANEAFVSVSTSADTAEFAVNSIKTWWETMGIQRYPDAECLMITADCGGSNAHRSRLWKQKLQEFADLSGLTIDVRHYPPGTSKWNKIEHRLFSFISMNWRGRPLESLEVIVNLIAATTNSSGLQVECGLDGCIYERGIRLTKRDMEELNIFPDEWRGDWNYTIVPRAEYSSK